MLNGSICFTFSCSLDLNWACCILCLFFNWFLALSLEDFVVIPHRFTIPKRNCVKSSINLNLALSILFLYLAKSHDTFYLLSQSITKTYYVTHCHVNFFLPESFDLSNVCIRKKTSYNYLLKKKKIQERGGWKDDVPWDLRLTD